MATMFLSGESLTIPSALASKTIPKVPFPIHKQTESCEIIDVRTHGIFDNKLITTGFLRGSKSFTLQVFWFVNTVLSAHTRHNYANSPNTLFKKTSFSLGNSSSSSVIDP